MGRHAAPDGTSAHPLVAEALARRPADAVAAHRRDGGASGRTGGLGWPGPPPGERGVGWPEKDAAEAGDDARSAARPRGWRRFFRLSPAA